MARLSDIIEAFIKELLKNTDGEIEIQRNELANYFRCAPSQINYVLSTRFTVDKGYYIESKRGGGGSIKIIRVKYQSHNNFIENIINNLGQSITQNQAYAIIDVLYENNLIDQKMMNLMKAVLNDKVLNIVDEKDTLRCWLLKSMLISIFNS